MQSAIAVIAQEKRLEVREQYYAALIEVAIAFIEEKQNRKLSKLEKLKMVSALARAWEKDPLATGLNMYAAGFFAAAIGFGILSGCAIVVPVIGAVSALCMIDSWFAERGAGR